MEEAWKQARIKFIPKTESQKPLVSDHHQHGGENISSALARDNAKDQLGLGGFSASAKE